MNDTQTATNLLPSGETELVFELGGPAYRLMQRIGVIKGAGPSVARRSVAFVAVTWLPLLVFAVLEGHAFGPTPRSAFLLDFATYARFFRGVPLLFAAEKIVGPCMRSAGLRFIHAGIVQPESYSGFAAAAARVRRRREACLPEVAFLAMAVLGAWFFTLDRLTGLSTTNWHTTLVNGEFQQSDRPRVGQAFDSDLSPHARGWMSNLGGFCLAAFGLRGWSRRSLRAGRPRPDCGCGAGRFFALDVCGG